MNLASRIFLSHSSEYDDSHFASALGQELALFGATITSLVRGNLRAGVPWWQAVTGAIDVADAFVAIVSDGYAKSGACLRELKYAASRKQGPMVFAIRAKDVRLSALRDYVSIECKSPLSRVSKSDLMKMAERIVGDAKGTTSPLAARKPFRSIEYQPQELQGTVTDRNRYVARRQERELLAAIQNNHVLVLVGPPAIGKSTLLQQALLRMKEYPLADAELPRVVIWCTCSAERTVDLSWLAAKVFDVIGPPPANATDHPTEALIWLLNECDAWLVLDQFENQQNADGSPYKDELATLLARADKELHRGRIILTSHVRRVMVRGIPLVHFDYPRWTSADLSELLESEADTPDSRLPPLVERQAIFDWAAAHPFLLSVAYRFWRSTGAPPIGSLGNSEPIAKLLAIVGGLSDSERLVLRILAMAPCRISVELLETVAESLQGAFRTNSNIRSEIARLSSLCLVEVSSTDSAKWMRVLDLVQASLFRDPSWTFTERDRVRDALLRELLSDAGSQGPQCEPLISGAVFDQGRWLWKASREEKITRYIRAAEILLATDNGPAAVSILKGRHEDNDDVLKYLNRFVPASFRKAFYLRFLYSTGLELVDQINAQRGLALALADAAEFADALHVLASGLGKCSRLPRILQVEHGYSLEARFEALTGYCLRHSHRSTESLSAYGRALSYAREVHDLEMECKVQRGLGNSLLHLGNLADAEQSFADARRTADDCASERRVLEHARIDADGARLLLRLDRIDDAKELCSRARMAMEEINDRWNERITALNLAVIDTCISRMDDDAVRCGLEEILTHMVNLENVLGIRACQRNLERLAAREPLQNLVTLELS